jgi:hypothetical protein
MARPWQWLRPLRRPRAGAGAGRQTLTRIIVGTAPTPGRNPSTAVFSNRDRDGEAGARIRRVLR